MSKKKKKYGECPYCGMRNQLTEEHVIPQCLFPKPRPSDMVKIFVCSPCNNIKSKDDDYFRDYLVSDVDSSNNSTAQNIFINKLLSSVRRNTSAFTRDVLSDFKQISLYSKGGIYLGKGIEAYFDGERINRIFRFIVRGLYYRKRQKRIPNNYIITSIRLFSDNPTEFIKNLIETPFNGPYRCGSVFYCFFAFAEEDEFISRWFLFFYDSICIEIRTNPKDFEWNTT